MSHLFSLQLFVIKFFNESFLTESQTIWITICYLKYLEVNPYLESNIKFLF